MRDRRSIHLKSTTAAALWQVLIVPKSCAIMRPANDDDEDDDDDDLASK